MQTLLPLFRCTNITILTHHEAVTPGVVEAGGAVLAVVKMLLELAGDGLAAFHAVDVAECLVADEVRTSAEMTIRSNRYDFVGIDTADIRDNVLL